MTRSPDSHKGQNGRVMIIGGSPEFYGAPILSSLGAEHSGVDLVYPYIPEMHREAAKAQSLNFIIHSFKGDILTDKDVKPILKLAETMDAVVMGPGLGTDPKTQAAIKKLILEIEKPLVLDASALIYTNIVPKIGVLTPHHGEFKRLTGQEPTPDIVQKWAKDMGVTIVCKGPVDIIAQGDQLALNTTGNSLMTVGGSGDVLSGLIGGLIAQGMTPFDAGRRGTELLGRAGDTLAVLQENFRAQDLAANIPFVAHDN